MNRRTFSRTLTGAALGAAGLVGELAKTSAQPLVNKEAPYELSIMLWTVFRKLPMDERLEKVAEAGYRNVELVGEYHRMTTAQVNAMNAKRKQLGIKFDTTAGLKHGVGTPKDREAMLADVHNELQIMEKLDCPACIIMSGNVVPGMPRDVQHDSCIEGLKRAAAEIEGKQIAGQPVRLLLENIDQEENPRYYMQSVAEAFEIVRQVNHPQVQVLNDFYHEQIAEGNLIEKIEKNIKYLGLVHIADVPGRHQPGTGEINYKNIYRKLGELNYSKIVAMEFYPQGDPIKTLRAAGEEALSSARA
ncbi:MAG TPA: TIM barrel protein [Bryobacteraceae bacterium]